MLVFALIFLTSCNDKEVKKIGGKIDELEDFVEKSAKKIKKDLEKFVKKDDAKEEIQDSSIENPSFAEEEINDIDTEENNYAQKEQKKENNEDDNYIPKEYSEKKSEEAIPASRSNVTKNLLDLIKPLIGNTNYSQGSRFTYEIVNNETDEYLFYLDCSSFARYLLKNTGFKYNFRTTDDIFKDRRLLNLNNLSDLEPGDLVGWPPTYSNGKKIKQGHVIVYLGEGKFIDVGGSRGERNAISFFNIEDIEKRIMERKMFFMKAVPNNNYALASY
jgi:cell wall-associated NlpC family hydrolase